MKIAIYHNLPSGGAKRTLFDQTRLLAGRHPIEVFSTTCADHQFCSLEAWVDRQHIYPFTALPLFRKPFRRLNQIVYLSNVRRMERLNRLIASDINLNGCEVVYVQPCQFTNSPSILKYLEKPAVYYCHETLRMVYDPPLQTANHRNRAQRALDRIDPLPRMYLKNLAAIDQHSLLSARAILVNSHFSKHSIEKAYHVSPRVCYHGIDISVFRNLGLERAPFVISVGALRKNKGFDFIVRSLACIPVEKRPRLVIVSNYNQEEERTHLYGLAQELGVDLEIKFLVPDGELVRLYNQALAAVYAPHMEPLGLVPLEAMACETPVVGVAEGGVKETIIDQVTGFLVDRDPLAFAQAVQQLVCDRQLRDRYGKQGRESVTQHWSLESAVARVEGYLGEQLD